MTIISTPTTPKGFDDFPEGIARLETRVIQELGWFVHPLHWPLLVTGEASPKEAGEMIRSAIADARDVFEGHGALALAKWRKDEWDAAERAAAAYCLHLLGGDVDTDMLSALGSLKASYSARGLRIELDASLNFYLSPPPGTSSPAEKIEAIFRRGMKPDADPHWQHYINKGAVEYVASHEIMGDQSALSGLCIAPCPYGPPLSLLHTDAFRISRTQAAARIARELTGMSNPNRLRYRLRRYRPSVENPLPEALRQDVADRLGAELSEAISRTLSGKLLKQSDFRLPSDLALVLKPQPPNAHSGQGG